MSGTLAPNSSRVGSIVRDSTQSLLDPSDHALQAPARTQDPSIITGTNAPTATHTHSTPRLLRQDQPSLTRAQKWAATANYNLDLGTYTTLFILIGLPIYFTTAYAMPAQLTINVIAYYGAQALPDKWKKFLHPVMVSSLLTVAGIWLLALSQRQPLLTELQQYQTRTKFRQLLQPARNNPKPGAGDVFSSVLEVSIVALALPMFQYRHELRKQFLLIILPNVVLALASLFGYPPICAAIGISPARSLAFASRSLTLALATPATANLGGDVNLVAVLCIVSGMLGILLGPRILDYLRIPPGRWSFCRVMACWVVCAAADLECR